MSGGRQADRATMMADVESLIRFHSDYQVFMSDPNLETYFGSAARGVDTPFEAGIAVLDWARHATVAVPRHEQGEPGAHRSGVERRARRRGARRASWR